MTYNAEKKNRTPLYVGEKISNSRGLGVKYSKVKITRHSVTCFHKCLEINCLNSSRTFIDIKQSK